MLYLEKADQLNHSCIHDMGYISQLSVVVVAATAVRCAKFSNQWSIWTYVIDVRNFPRLSLTHWGRVTHICVSKLTTIGSDNGLSPGRRQAIIWTNAGLLLIQTLGTNFSEILREIYIFSFKKMDLKMSFGKCRPSCLGLNLLRSLSDG